MATEDSGNDAAGLEETQRNHNSDAAAGTTATAAGEGHLPETPSEEELNTIATYFCCFKSPHPRPKCAPEACPVNAESLLAQGYL